MTITAAPTTRETDASRALTVGQCRMLAESWHLSLRAERKSPQTLKVYGDGLRFYLDWCESATLAPLARTHLVAWVNDLLDGGAMPATARSRQLAVRRYSAWLLEEREVLADPFVGLTPPRLDHVPVEPLTEDQLRALIAACAPPRAAEPKVRLRHVRDEAIIRFMMETGARASEVVDLTTDDVDLRGGIALIRRGKGGKGRTVPIGPATTRALDRYIRLRREHRLAKTPALWVGDRGKGFSYYALHSTLRMRALIAGVDGFHPHRLRHTAADRWLSAGGSEGGLMAIAGWTRPDMLHRYTKARAAARAADEARTLDLGNI